MKDLKKKKEAISGNSEEKPRHMRKKPDVRAEEILVVAREMLAEEGYEGLTFRAVALRTGVRMSSVQYYYPNRGDLYAAVVAKTTDNWYQSAKQILEADRPAEDRLHDICQWNISQCMNEETRSVLIQLLGLSQKESRVKEALETGYLIYRTLFANVLREIRPDLSPDVLLTYATLFVSHLEGLTFFLDAGDPGRPAEGVIRELSKSVVSGYVFGLKSVSADLKSA